MYEPQLIEGKPYFGEYFGNYILIQPDIYEIQKEWVENQCKHSLLNWVKDTFDQALERRNETWIIRQPDFTNILRPYASVGLKLLIWGRAFKIMKLMKKGVKRYKKVYQNGRRILKRIDK
jgi:hypothetical protein